MRKAVVFGLAMGTTAFGYVFMVQRHEDTAHICRSVGEGPAFARTVKLKNYAESKYFSLTKKKYSTLDLNGKISQQTLEDEVHLLQGNWAPSPLINEKKEDLIRQQRDFYTVLEDAFNDKLSPFSPMGIFLQNKSFERHAGNRTNIIAYLKDKPELLEGGGLDKNNRMTMIMGGHRTGSTYLQNLLAQDPRCRTTYNWEMVDTIPPATKKEDFSTGGDRAATLQQVFDTLDSISPGYYDNLKKMHYMAFDKPEEDLIILFSQFCVWYYKYFLREAQPELVNLNRDRAPYICRYLHLYLKMLDSSCPAESHWILKNPDHSQYLEDFLNEFPEANIIVTHRNPVSVVGSWYKLLFVIFHLYFYNDYAKMLRLPQPQVLTDPAAWGNAALDQSYEEITRLMKSRELLKESNPAAEKQIYDVCFTDLVTKPVEVVKDIYQHFGYEFTPEFEEKLNQYIAANPSGKHGRMRYNIEDVGLSKESIDTRFSEYISRYQEYF